MNSHYYTFYYHWADICISGEALKHPFFSSIHDNLRSTCKAQPPAKVPQIDGAGRDAVK